VKVLRAVPEVVAWRDAVEGRVAFVPTMGFLHDGHVSLMHAARTFVPAGTGEVCISIFVNPLQFDRAADLSAYPRDEAGDLEKARAAGVDVAFCPLDPALVHPKDARTFVEVEGLDRTLCGARRPGHFRGVCTVVAKLWNLVRPDVGLFGRKDYQQLKIIERMHRDLHLPGRVVGLPTVRETDGLALSSRNHGLDAEARLHARAIPRFLSVVSARFAAGERTKTGLLADAEHLLQPGVLEYAELVDAEDLEPLERVSVRAAVVGVAAWVAGVRLIDNLELPSAE
jgi:pantoate--beta-alanine ligase